MAVQNLLILFIFVLLGFLLIGFLLSSKKNKRPPDYYALFVIGITWVAIGLPLQNYTLSILGAAFMLSGILNKNKWKTNRGNWDNLRKEEKIVRGVLIFGLTAFLFLGLIIFYLAQEGVL